MGSLSIWHWLIVLAIVVLVFGTKKLKNVGEDLGSAVKSFKQAMKEEEATPAQVEHKPAGQTIEGEVRNKTTNS